MKILLFLLVILCGLACYAYRESGYVYTRVSYVPVVSKVIPIWIDYKFGMADKNGIMDAVNQWNYALNGHIVLEVVDTSYDMSISVLERVRLTGGWIILRVGNDSPMVVNLNKPKTLAWADRVGGNYVFVIRDRMDGKWVTGVMLHEMGHLLGASHGVNLMAAQYRWDDCRCIDLESLKLVAVAQGLSIDKLNYCQYL
jgi:frataxin-like iron-binding protein CyaY